MTPSLIRSLTLRWLSRQDAHFIGICREHYADHLSVPIIETNERFESTEEVEWVWGAFGREICALSNVPFPIFNVSINQSL